MKYEHKCSVCGRTDRYYAKGLCFNCYRRFRKNGDFEDHRKGKGIGSRTDKFSEKTKRTLELYRSGMTQVNIANEVGLTRQAVSLVIKKYYKPANVDKLRSMTVEELADFCVWMCPPGKNEILSCEPQKELCRQCWLDWLRQEVDHE